MHITRLTSNIIAAPKTAPAWPTAGFVVIRQILGQHGGPIPVSPSKWWAGVKTGDFPRPLKIGGRTVWRVGDIDALIARLSAGHRDHHSSDHTRK